MYKKYPRTPHLSWSLGASSDDKIIESVDCFVGKEVVVTEKIDGENCTMYNDHIHARSIESKAHPSRTWVRQLHANIKFLIPKGYRICGENVYAKHSIHYQNLPNYFLIFGIYDDKDCFSWDETKEWAELLALHTVPELYRGPWDEQIIKNLWQGKSFYGGEGEGYVVRTAGRFPYDLFGKNVAKFVRENHVTTSDHWLTQAVVKNELIYEAS